MADISYLSRLLGGTVRNVDIAANTLVTTSIKVGGLTPTELTKTILDRLVNLQNGSDVDATHHTHDGRYYTETELASTTSGSSGARLVGADNKAYTNIAGLTTYTIQDFIERIDAALGNANVNVFSDDVFRIADNIDSTKRIAFEAAGIATATTRTITMPDENVNLGLVSTAFQKDGSVVATGDFNLGGFKITNMANAVNAQDAVTKSQLDAVISLINNFEWQDSVLDRTVTPPGSPNIGDRYLIDSNLGVATGAFTGEEDNIAEYNGTGYDFYTPTLGTFVSVDDESNAMYYFGGASWSAKYFESTTASTGLVKVGFDIRLDSSVAGSGLAFNAGVLSLDINDLTAASITATDYIAFADVSDSNLSKKILFSDFESTLNHDNLNGYVTNEHVDHSTVQIATAANTSGLTGGGDITATRNLSVDINGTTAETIADNADKILIYDNSAGALKSMTRENFLSGSGGVKDMVAGESFAANTSFLVRYALTGETAGRVYKADYDASVTDEFYAIGIALSTSAVNAGDTIRVTIQGTHILGASDSAFAGAEVGQAVHLLAAGAFDAVSQITYTEGSGQAAYRIGIVENTDRIFVTGIQLNGVY